MLALPPAQSPAEAASQSFLLDSVGRWGGRGSERSGVGVGQGINADAQRPLEGAAPVCMRLELVALPGVGLVLQELRHRQAAGSTNGVGEIGWVGKVRSSQSQTKHIITLPGRLRSTSARVFKCFVKKDLACVALQPHFGKEACTCGRSPSGRRVTSIAQKG